MNKVFYMLHEITIESLILILHTSCGADQLDQVKLLIDTNQIDIKSKDKNGITIFHYSCESENFYHIKYVISLTGINVSENDNM